MDELTTKLFLYLIIVFSAVFHEYAHGWMAYRLGDPTAKYEGRLTLNPLAHVELFGTVLLPLLLLFTTGLFLGWAKPVPYNPYNLSDPKYGSLKVAAAGPGTNFIIALFLGLLLRFGTEPLLAAGIGSPLYFQLLAWIVYVNIFLALFNLLPLPPLDGSKVFADLFPSQRHLMEQVGFFGLFIALFAAFFLLSPLANFIFFLFTGSFFFISV